jgi:hypothetical protein
VESDHRESYRILRNLTWSVHGLCTVHRCPLDAISSVQMRSRPPSSNNGHQVPSYHEEIGRSALSQNSAAMMTFVKAM